MTGKRIFAIVAIGVLVTGMLTVLWLMTLPSRHQTSSHIGADQRAEKERQRHEIVQEVAFKQQRLEERQLAEARRMAEQERQRRQDEEKHRLADTVRSLEKERVRQAEVVQASLRQRQDEELRLAQQERHRREAEAKATAHQRHLEDERRLSDAVRQLEKERVRQSEIVQASMKQRADAERVPDQRGATLVSTKAKGAAPAVVEIADRPAAPKGSKYRAASTKGHTTGPRRARRQSPASNDSWVHLCPWRWLQTMVVELTGHPRIAERARARRYS